MRLSELKKMVKEEYNRYLAEQAMPSLPANPGAGGTSPVAGAGSAPKVTVEPGDIDVAGGEDAEATLRDIYEMLKDFFEGGGASTPTPSPAAAAGADDDLDDDDDADDDADDDDDDDKVDEKKEDKEDKKEGKKDKEDLKERFKKLANIVKG